MAIKTITAAAATDDDDDNDDVVSTGALINCCLLLNVEGPTDGISVSQFVTFGGNILIFVL